MPRRARYSGSPVARVRAWFGLTQDELALYLAVSPALVRHYESGRREPGFALFEALRPLLRQVPADVTVTELDPRLTETLRPLDPGAGLALLPALPPGTPPPEVEELKFRSFECQVLAMRARQQAGGLAARATLAARWAQALPALLALPEATPYTAPPDPGHEAWRQGWLTRRAQPLPADEAAHYYLLLARAAALEAQAATLAALLP